MGGRHWEVSFLSVQIGPAKKGFLVNSFVIPPGTGLYDDGIDQVSGGAEGSEGAWLTSRRSRFLCSLKHLQNEERNCEGRLSCWMPGVDGFFHGGSGSWVFSGAQTGICSLLEETLMTNCDQYYEWKRMRDMLSITGGN